jgi:C1A family cysteine protease
MDNYMAIVEHNRVNKDFELGVNQFADMTLAEIKAKFLKKREATTPCTKNHTPIKGDPKVDWRTKNAVTQVKNQGNCGSCWAFSTTGALEGLQAIKKGKLVELSEQELVDCSRSYGNEGCNGGDMSAAFEYVKDKGISTEAEYPYEGRDRSCRKKSASFQVSGCVNVTHNDNDELLEALTIGPVSIAVKANNMAFMYYRSGVIKSGCGRESDELDHGITLVGAAFESGTNTPYWICKNSWGRSWGQAGYVYIKRDTGKSAGVCGIAMEDSYPVLE